MLDSAPNWGRAERCNPNETFSVGDYDFWFDVSAVKGVRPRMEDRWNVAVHERGHAAVMAVYDGHGGPQAGPYTRSVRVVTRAPLRCSVAMAFMASGNGV
jgi:hypothetical protein